MSVEPTRFPPRAPQPINQVVLWDKIITEKDKARGCPCPDLEWHDRPKAAPHTGGRHTMAASAAGGSALQAKLQLKNVFNKYSLMDQVFGSDSQSRQQLGRFAHLPSQLVVRRARVLRHSMPPCVIDSLSRDASVAPVVAQLAVHALPALF